MADYNAELKVFNGAEWDRYNPVTTAENVKVGESDLKSILDNLDTKRIVITNEKITFPADGFCYAQHSGNWLLAAHNINGGTHGITRINNRGNNVYNLIMPDYKKGETTTVQCFWLANK